MKHLSVCLICLSLICSFQLAFTQSSKGFNYQAVARDNTGSVLANTAVNLRFQVREGTATGTIVYQETHAPSTNTFGLIQAQIGKGTTEVGSFAALDWASGDYFLSVELNGSSMGTTLFEAVPYAKVATAMDIENLQNVNASSPLTDQVLKWNGTEWIPGDVNTGTTYVGGTGISVAGSTITNTAPDQTVSLIGSGATGVTGTYPNFTISSTDNVDDADADASNELQTLSVSGSNLTLSNGNTVAIPSTSFSAGTGISIAGTTISNSAPDQTVSLIGSGATGVTGTYPNFTISSTDNVNDADASTTNEIQSVSLSGNTLSLSLGGGSVSLASFSSPWNNSGSNLYFNTGKIGIGDNSPIATLTVGNGDKFQVHGSDGDIVLKDDQGSLRFANSNGSNASMIQMFQSGTNNSTRMLVSHSPSFSTWGIQYNDTADAFTWIGDGIPVFYTQLSGSQRVGVGTDEPEAKFHVTTNSTVGSGQMKVTEEGFDYSRITLNNDIHPTFWEIAARTDTNLANSQMNLYHSEGGNVFSVNARGRIGINDASPSYAMEVNGNQSTRIMNLYNNLPTTTSTTYNYGLRVSLSQVSNTGFPRLYNVYGRSTDSDAYLSYGLYGYASGASSNNYGVYGYAPTTSGYAGYFSGNVYTTASYLPSDARLKSDISPLQSGLETLLQLRPKQYQYDREKFEFMNLPEGGQYGFLAQEVAQLLPDLTISAFQPYEEALSDTDEGQGFEFTAINYTGLIPIVVAGVQEQQAIIDSQQAEIERLEARLEALEVLVQQLVSE